MYAIRSYYGKRWQGEIRGLKRMNAMDIKHKFEQDFENWYLQSEEITDKYALVLPAFEKLYTDLRPYDRAYNYYAEIVYRGTDILTLASSVPRNKASWEAGSPKAKKDRITSYNVCYTKLLRIIIFEVLRHLLFQRPFQPFFCLW